MALIDGEANLEQLRAIDHIYVEVLDVSLKHLGEDNSGPILDGSLTLKRRLHPLGLEADRTLVSAAVDGLPQKWHVDLDTDDPPREDAGDYRQPQTQCHLHLAWHLGLEIPAPNIVHTYCLS